MEDNDQTPNNANNTEATQPEALPQPSPAEQPPPENAKKKKLNPAVIIGAAIAILIGGSAAAYFGVIVPNKPENVLKTAAKNSLEQDEVAFKGSSTFTSSDNSTFNLNVDGEVDFADNAFRVTNEVGGAQLELRRIDGSAYVRISDLKKAQATANATGSEYADLLALLDNRVANRWLEVDPALLSQSEAECGLDVSDFDLRAEDIEILFERYEETPFFTIKSTAVDKIDGQDTKRFVLEIDNRKAQEYGQNLGGLSIIKKLESCGLDQAEQNEDTKDGSSELTVWVDSSSKTVAKISGESADEPNDTFELELDYRPVDIDKPRDTLLLSQAIRTLLTDITQGTNDLVGGTLRGTGELVQNILEGVGGLVESIFQGLNNRR